MRAYDDAAGVTAAFNRNVLAVLDRELDADFDLDAFEHVALWDAGHEWIEMRLRSRVEQVVSVAALDLEVPFAAGEELRTEISAKFRRAGVEAELAAAGLAMTHWWTDPGRRLRRSPCRAAPRGRVGSSSVRVRNGRSAPETLQQPSWAVDPGQVRVSLVVYGVLYVVLEMVGHQLELVGWSEVTALDVATAVTDACLIVAICGAVLLGPRARRPALAADRAARENTSYTEWDDGPIEVTSWRPEPEDGPSIGSLRRYLRREPLHVRRPPVPEGPRPPAVARSAGPFLSDGEQRGRRAEVVHQHRAPGTQDQLRQRGGGGRGTQVSASRSASTRSRSASWRSSTSRSTSGAASG